MRARNGPGVGARVGIASGRELEAGAIWEQEVHFVRFTVVQHLLFDDLGLPVAGQSTEHLKTAQDGIDDAPWPRIVVEENELDAITAAMRLDPGVDSARIGFHSLLVG